ncbi:MAG TPA: type I asparaginase [Bacteroidales bacterium]|nr:type I asparaginase [Bacteroidales bacterium]
MTIQKSILVIYTGGTIGMVQDPRTGSMKPLGFDNLYHFLPMLENFNYRIEFITFAPLLDSSNMTPSFWIELATVIETHYESFDGFVVLHGSDTMAYTASALSFMLENLNKPVIFTGSQLPIGMVRTDGRENFINSIEIAAASEDDTPIVPEVAICFENKLFRGNRTSKFNAENFGAFISGNFPLLAEIGVNINYHRDLILKPNFKKLKCHKILNENIAILKLFPGIGENVIRCVLHIEGLKAVILETFGSGNAPTAPWFLDMLKDAIARGIIVFNVTQCKGGTVEHGKYETSAELGKLGIVGGYDITTESALTKLMYLLGAGFSREEVEKYLQISLRGEMTV